MSNVRLIARWHNGNDRRTIDTIAPDTVTALNEIDTGGLPLETIARMLQSPNDVHRAKRVEWSWWTIVQVWERDKRPAGEILSDARRHSVTPAGQSPKDGAYPFTCSYGCDCGAFPLSANYHQALATDG